MSKTPDDRLAQDFGTKVRRMIHSARRAGEVKTVEHALPLPGQPLRDKMPPRKEDRQDPT